MFEFVSEHQFWAAVAIYWIFSAAVSSIIKASPWRARASRPDPRTVGSAGYLWLYRFLHSIAGNVTTAFAGKIPGLNTFLLVVRFAGLAAVPSRGAVSMQNSSRLSFIAATSTAATLSSSL